MYSRNIHTKKSCVLWLILVIAISMIQQISLETDGMHITQKCISLFQLMHIQNTVVCWINFRVCCLVFAKR